MALISLTKGFTAEIDDADIALVSLLNWQAQDSKHTTYARGRLPGGGQVYMHRYILGETNPKHYVDHINGDGLYNRRENLRVSLQFENHRNTLKRAAASSMYKGVKFTPRNRKWVARIRVGTKENGTEHNLGVFKTEIEAALAYDIQARILFGPSARLNFPIGEERSAIGVSP